MFDIQTQSGAPPKLARAWLFYTTEERHSSGQPETFVTEHGIRLNGEDQPQLGPGRPLEEKSLYQTMERMAQARPVRHQHAGLLDPNILQFDATKMTWFVPGQRRPMWLQQRERALQVAWPDLVFHVSERGFCCWAVADAKRPTADTPVFHAPLANFYRDGRLCMGNATAGNLTIESIPVWEEAVFNTRFTHVNHELTLAPDALNVDNPEGIDSAAHFRFWKACDRDRNASFPTQALVPFTRMGSTPMTVGEVLP